LRLSRCNEKEKYKIAALYPVRRVLAKYFDILSICALWGSTPPSFFGFRCSTPVGVNRWPHVGGKELSRVSPERSSRAISDAPRNDMMNAAREAVIVSPFVTRRRTWQMLPNLEAALAKGVSVVVLTRPTDAYKDKDRPALEETLASLQDAGVRLMFKANIHQKFAVIDQKIVWYGSINLLSYGSAQESLMRIESSNIAQELLKDLGKPLRGS